MPITFLCPVCGQSKKIPVYRASFRRACSLKCAGKIWRKEALQRRTTVIQPKDYRIIPLSNGVHIKVSIEDYDVLSETPWHQLPGGYAIDRNSVRLHRVVATRMFDGIPDGLHVDHINGDTTDNRRENLRLATRVQNASNRRLNRTNKSGYKGVSLWRNGKWQCYIRVNNQQIHIGYFIDPEEAAWMRDQWAIALHGDFARLNYDYM